MEMDSTRLVPLARLRRNLGPHIYQASTRGDGLYNLSLPAVLWLYEDKKKNNDLRSTLELPAHDTDSPSGGKLYPARLLRIWGSASNKKYARIEMEVLRSQDAKSFPTQTAWPIIAAHTKNLWLCASQAQLNTDFEEPYLFQVIGLRVTSRGRTVAKVKDYFETKAHGILVLTLYTKEGENSQELMLPCVEEHVLWGANLDHIEVPHFESFLEAQE